MYNKIKDLRLYESIFQIEEDEWEYGPLEPYGTLEQFKISKGYYYSSRQFELDSFSRFPDGTENKILIDPKIVKQFHLSKSKNHFRHIELLNREEFASALLHLNYYHDRCKKLTSVNGLNETVKFLDYYLDFSLDWFKANKLKEPDFRIKDVSSNIDLFTWGGSQAVLEILFNQLKDNYLEDELTLSEFEAHFIVDNRSPIATEFSSKINFQGSNNELSFLISKLGNKYSKNFIMDDNYLVLTSKNFLVKGKGITAKQLNKAELTSRMKIRIINTIISTLKKE